MAEYYSLDEVAKRLGKTEDEIREMVGSGELRAFRDAGVLKFRRADIDRTAPPPGESGELEVVAEAEDTGGLPGVTPAESERDELLFLIDEEGTPGDPDDLTLIGDKESEGALGTAESEDLFVLTGEEAAGAIDDEANTVVDTGVPMAAAAAEPAGAVDLVAEAEAEMAVEAEAQPVVGVVSRAQRLRQMQEAARERSPVMSVLLVVGFLALAWTGFIVYNSFVQGPKPAFVESLIRSIVEKHP